MPSIRTAVAVLGTSALLGGLASPALAQEATYPTDTGTSTTQTQKPAKGKKKGKRHAGRLTDAQLTKVAEALGVTLAQLKAAQAEVKTETKATEARETRAQEQALLAEKLGKTAAEVKAAFDSVRPARGAEGQRPAKGDCKRPAQTDQQSDDTTADYPTSAS